MIRHIFDLCGCGGIGRRARFRFWWETVQVQVLLSAGTPYRHKNRMFLLKHPIFVPFIEKS